MKYCVYCGHQVDKKDNICPNCYEDITEEKTDKLYHSNVECIKCKSKNVDYKIIRKNKSRIVYEEQIYTCNECGKQFNDRNRLGYSFNNTPQLILNGNSKKIIKILLTIAVFIFICFKLDIMGMITSKQPTTYDYVQNCTGLQTMKLADIYHAYNDNKESATEMYVGKPFIFEGKIFRIDMDKGILQLDSEEISPEVYFNKAEKSKLENYKAGDNIRLCGVLKNKKTILSVPIFVENATIID